jgi:hypothetical protein
MDINEWLEKSLTLDGSKAVSVQPAEYQLVILDEMKAWRRQELIGEFALILAAKGHLVGYDALEQLADVAIGDV